ncbi:MAG: hypothetical protein KDE25_14605 [Novosphingobium sp.]|nr:hypothetical protein [Novosphingobium sp.]
MSRNTIALKTIITLFSTALPGTIAYSQSVEIRQITPPTSNNSEVVWPLIEVDGTGTKRYDRVYTKEVDIFVEVFGTGRPKRTEGSPAVGISVESGRTSAREAWQKKSLFKVTFPYVDPMSQYVTGSRVSPIKLCNDKLNATKGAARTAFLREGVKYNYGNAWKARVSAQWWTKGLIKEERTYDKDAQLFARIVCRPLLGPKVRTKTSTTGSSGTPRTSAPQPTRTNPPPTRMNPAPVRTNPAPVRTDPIPPPPPPSATPGDLDVRIRGANRNGPGGAVQMWVYNAGPDPARGCQIDWRDPVSGNFTRVATLPSIAARETKQVANALPSDANSRFRVQCANEPASANGNNGYALP